MQSRRSPSTVAWSTSLIAGVVIVALFAILTLLTRVQGVPVFTPPDFVLPEGVSPFPESTEGPAEVVEPPRREDAPFLTVLINILMAGAIAAVLVATAFLIRWLVRMIRDAWNERRLRLQGAADVGVDVVAEPVAEAAIDAPVMRRGISGALASFNEEAVASDAIVAAWVGLEETARDAGIVRGRSETPAEFTLRLIIRTEAIREPAEALLRAYEKVRFGGGVATEADRHAARAALHAIEEGWK